MNTSNLTTVILETAPNGRARFREEAMQLPEVKPGLFLSTLRPSGGLQLRQSPPGYRMDFHCTVNPAWTFVLGGALEIGLPDGTTRLFEAGTHFYAQDHLPEGAVFDPTVHGHCTRQVGDATLVTAIVRG